MRRMEVRCCCTPNKLLGTLPIMDKDSHAGTKISFVLMRPSTREAKEFGENSVARNWRDNTIELEVTPWRESRLEYDESTRTTRDAGSGGLALKREGVTVEILRRIPGFIEAPHG